MTVDNGRRLFATRHRRYTEDQLPPADTPTAREALRYRSARGDHLATQALAEWEKAQQQPPAPEGQQRTAGFEAGAGDIDDLGGPAA